MLVPKPRQFMRRIIPAALAAATMSGAGVARAEDYSLTDIQLLATHRSREDVFNGTGTRDEKLTVLRAEHFGTWAYGDNLINLDLFHGEQVGGGASGSFGADTGNQMFFIYQPRISFSKLAGREAGTGFIKDVYLTARREQASYANFWANNVGVSFDLNLPGVAFFEQDFMVRKTSADASTKWLSRTVWLAPMHVGGMDIHFDGLILVKSTDNFGTNVLAQPDLLIDVLPKGRLQAGVRVEYARYKTPGGASYRRTTPFLMAKLVF
jgi:nucleoside-specific outer membrane channel protein Tsx